MIKVFIMRLAKKKKKVFSQTVCILPRSKNPKSCLHGLTANANIIAKGEFSDVITNLLI